MKYKLNKENTGPIEIDADLIQVINNHGFEFIIHRSVDSDQWDTPIERRAFVISEITSGAKVAQGRTITQCLQQAEEKLSRKTTEEFTKIVKDVIDLIAFNEEPFRKAVYSTGITVTESEVEDLRTALKDLLK